MNAEPNPPAKKAVLEGEPLSIGEIAQRIHLIRGQRVVLDADLAAFYGETTKRFNQQVSRNLARFPADFMFQLNEVEFSALRLQFATLKTGRGQHRKYLPYVFTEHGAIMAATLLNSPRATATTQALYRVRAPRRETKQGQGDQGKGSSWQDGLRSQLRASTAVQPWSAASGTVKPSLATWNFYGQRIDLDQTCFADSVGAAGGPAGAGCQCPAVPGHPAECGRHGGQGGLLGCLCGGASLAEDAGRRCAAGQPGAGSDQHRRR